MRSIQKQFLRVLFAVMAGVAIARPAIAAIEVDVALSYSPNAASNQGGEDNIQVNLANAIVGGNAVHETSGTGVRWRIAGFYQSTANPVDQDNNYVLGLVNSDASFQDVRNFGASVGADLVSYYAHTTGAAGNAYQPGTYSTMGEQWIYYLVVAHELGHNHGCAHEDGRESPKTVMMHNYCGGGSQGYFSNPHTWLNGTQLIGNGNICLGGSQISGGDNAWRLATSAQGKADAAARIVSGPNFNNVVLRWCFTNAPGSAPAGTTVSDLVTAAPAVVRGINGTFTGRALRTPGGTTGNVAVNSMSAYIDLPNGIISSRSSITIEIWATPLSAPNWARLCDFGRPVQAGDGLGAAGEYTGTPGSVAPGATSSSDNIMLSAATGTSLGSQRFEARLDAGTAVTLDSGLATTAGVPHHYAITFTHGAGSYGAAGGRWQWYRDGDPIAFLDVNFHLADIEDVNNWLGRSMWSTDSNANNDYHEVRISDVALPREQLLAHFLLGPNFFPTATVLLTNSDAAGASSFNAAGQWNNGASPNGAQSYETLNLSLRTPASAGSFTFGGSSLKITGGNLLFKGTSSATITMNNLTLDGGTIAHAGSGTFTIAGTIAVSTNGGVINGVNGVNTLSAGLNGAGTMEFLGNTTTISGNNSAFTGRWIVGNGAPGGIQISSPAAFGVAPSSFTSNHVTLHRGSLATTATMTLNDATRGFLLERGGGTFNVSAGTTLTLGNVSTPVMSASYLGGALIKTGGGTLIFSNTSSTFRGALYVDSSSTTSSDGIVRIVNNQTLANAQSPVYIRNNNSGSSTLQLDGSAGGLTISKGVNVNCRNNATAAIQNVAGTNTITGFIALNSGGNTLPIQSDAGQLIFNGTHQYIGSLTGGRTYNFTGNGHHLLNGPILNSTNGAPISLTKSGTGTLTLAGANTYTNTTTVSGGTMLVNGSLAITPVTVASTATLGGIGTLAGTVTVQSGGTMSPGAAGVGRLTVNNAVTLQAGSATRIEINKSANTNDQLRVVGALNYGGSLTVTNLSGTLAANDSFQIFNPSSVSGSFSATNLPSLGSGLAWNFNPASGVLSVVATVSTTPTNLNYSVSSNALTLSWPASHVGWRLETNAAGLDATNAWFTFPGSPLTNLSTLPVEAERSNVFFRLVYP